MSDESRVTALMEEVRAREALTYVMRAAVQRGLVDVLGGNASVRVDGGFVITPSQVPKDLLRPWDMVFVSWDGEWVGPRKPSMEWRMHKLIYEVRPDAGAVLHLHNRTALALHEAGLGVRPGDYVEAHALGDCVAIVPFMPAGTEELASEVAKAMKVCRAAVLLRHGIVVAAENLYIALDAAEALEDLSAVAVIKNLAENR